MLICNKVNSYVYAVVDAQIWKDINQGMNKLFPDNFYFTN